MLRMTLKICHTCERGQRLSLRWLTKASALEPVIETPSLNIFVFGCSGSVMTHYKAEILEKS
jgi:hypothetical protein